MDLKTIAEELVAGCRENRAIENLDRLYAPDAVSVEAADMGRGRVTEGLAGIRGKHEWWESSMEVSGGSGAEIRLRLEGQIPERKNAVTIRNRVTFRQ